MRILLAAPQPFYQERGTPIAVRMLAETLAELGHAVDLLVLHEGEDVSMPGVTVHRTASLPGLHRVPPGFSWKKAVCDLLMVRQMLRLHRQHRYDVVHSVEESAMLVRMLQPLLRVPFIYDMDSSIPEQIRDKFSLPPFVVRLIERFESSAIRRSVAVVAVCRALEDRVRRVAPDKPTLRLEDVSLLREGEPADRLREQLNLKDGLMALYVGNLERYQGIDLMLEALAEAARRRAGLHLVIVGGRAAHVAHYRRRAAALGLADRVHLLGPRPLAQLASLLSQADLLVSPRVHGANTPMKIYSYMDSGAPILATRLPTHSQVLDEEVAVLCEPDSRSMAEGWLKLAGDAGLRRRLADAARRRVAERHSPEAFKAKLARFYAGVERMLHDADPSAARHNGRSTA